MEDSARRPWWRRRWVVAGAALLLVLGLGWGIDRRGAETGRHVAGEVAHSGSNFEQHFTAEVPGGYLDVTTSAGKVVRTANGDKSTAPDGTAYVEVDWTPHVLDDAPVWPASPATRRKAPRAELILVSGGRHYTVASKVAATGKPSSTVIVVKGSAGDGEVRVRFGDRTQQATLQDGDSRYSGASRRDEMVCVGRAHVDAHVRCTLVASRLGYVAGLGTAPKGKEWLVVHDSTVTRQHGDVTVTDAAGHRATYRPSGKPTVTLTVDGLGKPDRVAGQDTVEGDEVRLTERAWLMPADEAAKVQLRYRLPTRLVGKDPGMPRPPATRAIEQSGTVTYRG